MIVACTLFGMLAATESIFPEGFKDSCWENKVCKWKSSAIPKVAMSEIVRVINNQWSVVEVIWGFKQNEAGLRLGEDIQIGSIGNKEEYIKERSHTHGRLGGEQLLSSTQEAEGTLIMTDADGRFYNIRSLQHSISSTLQLEGSTSLYYTTRGTGVPVHQDYMDVIACQVEGQKKWRVWDAMQDKESCTESELSFLNLTSSHHVSNVTFLENSGYPYTEYVLEENDCLYLPRGVPHQAFQQGSDPSLHMSIGLEVAGRTWEDVLHYAISSCESIRTPIIHDDVSVTVQYPEAMHLIIKAVSYKQHKLRMIAEKHNILGLEEAIRMITEVLTLDDFLLSLPIPSGVLAAARDVLPAAFSVAINPARVDPISFLSSWNSDICEAEYSKRLNWFSWFTRNMKISGIEVDEVPVMSFCKDE